MKPDIFVNPQRWIVAAMLIIATYWMYYYADIGQTLLQSYEKRFWAVQSVGSDPTLVILAPQYIGDGDLLSQKMIVYAHSSITETRSSPIDMTIRGEIQNSTGVDSYVLITSDDDSGKTGMTSGANFEVPAQGSAVKTFSIGVLNGGKITSTSPITLTVVVNGQTKNLDTGGKSIPIEFNRAESFKQTAIRALIFPPFSNGVLIFIPLIITWLVDPLVRGILNLLGCLFKLVSFLNHKNPSSNKSVNREKTNDNSDTPPNKDELHCTQCGKPIKQCPLCHNPPETFDWKAGCIGFLRACFKFVLHPVLAFCLLVLTYRSLDTVLLRNDAGWWPVIAAIFVFAAWLIYILEDTHRKEIS